MTGLAKVVFLARKPWSKHSKKQRIVILLCFGLSLVLRKVLFCLRGKVGANYSASDPVSIKDLITAEGTNQENNLIEADWEPWKSHDFLRCDSTNGSIEVPSNAHDGWFPYIDNVKQDNFIIISNTNCGYLDFALNFWEHYQTLGYTNIVFIAEDCIAYNILTSKMGKYHVAPPIMTRERTNEDEIFSEIFRNMTVLRPRYLHYFLNRGVSVMWQDIDSVPLRNTMDFFPKGYDIVAVDDYVGDAHYSSNYLCACLLLLNPTRHAFRLLNIWMAEIENNINNPNDNDQLAFNRALGKLRKSKEITLTVLPRTVYPNGHDYDNFASTAAWIHANYLIGGQSKRDFLMKRGYWISTDYSYSCGN